MGLRRRSISSIAFGTSVRSPRIRLPQIGVVGEMVDERLDQVLGRLEAARDELEQHVEEDVVGELLLADLVLLLEDASDRVGLGVGAARCDERLDDLPHLGADAGEVGERLGRALGAAAAREEEGEALVHQRG